MKNQNYYQVFTRRMMLLGAGKLALLGTVGFRYFDLQINNREKYSTLSDQNKFTLRLRLPERGKILDRNEIVLADNSKSFQVSIIPEKSTSVEETLSVLRSIYPMSDENFASIKDRVNRTAKFKSIVLLDNIDHDVFNKIMVNYHNLTGIDVAEVPRRIYPFAEKMAHLTGYVGEPTKEDAIAADLRKKQLANNQRFIIGRQALEKSEDTRLRGVPGIERLEVNAYGRTVRSDTINAGISGQNLMVTIDAELQAYIYDLLATKIAGSAVVMDTTNGEILSMVSVPSYDCNLLTGKLTQQQWLDLVNNPLAPLNDRSCRSAYPPGSTFKPVVALAALRDGMKPSHTAFCRGKIKVGDSTLHCWKRGGHGHMDMYGALRESCDVWFYRTAEALGISKIAAEARRLGLGQEHKLPLGKNHEGLIGTPDWKRATHDAPWYLGDTLVAAIGQGYVLASPLQLAIMTAKIASGNMALEPHLTIQNGQNGQNGSPNVRQYDLPENLDIVRKGLWQVVNQRIGGTAYKSRLKSKDFQMAGKTGTSQVHRLSKAEREAIRAQGKKFEKPWELRDHALFIGYAPFDNPRYAVSVIVEHGKSGSGTAAPIVKKIMEYLHQKEQPTSA